MSATSIDDARSRAASILESLEKSINSRASSEAAQSFHKVSIESSVSHIDMIFKSSYKIVDVLMRERCLLRSMLVKINQ